MMRILAILAFLFLVGYAMNSGGLPQTGVSAPAIGSAEGYSSAAKRAIGGLMGK